MSKLTFVQQFLNSHITEDMSVAEKIGMIDDIISQLKDEKSKYYGKVSFAERQREMTEKVNAFFKRVSNMSVGTKSKVKRGLGFETNFCNMDIVSFGDNYYIEDLEKPIWDLCARLYCFFDCKENKEVSFATQVGKVCKSETSIVKFNGLLGTSIQGNDRFEAYSRDLINFARQIKSKGLTFNFSELLVDLLSWEYKSRSVQQRWAKDFETHLNNEI